MMRSEVRIADQARAAEQGRIARALLIAGVDKRIVRDACKLGTADWNRLTGGAPADAKELWGAVNTPPPLKQPDDGKVECAQCLKRVAQGCTSPFCKVPM